jgi:cyclopropane fatty-acyl-phospholipid synthase-like methyltransferase
VARAPARQASCGNGELHEVEPDVRNAARGRLDVTARLSPRLQSVVDALPLRKGMRVLEIGCGPGAAAREVVARIGDGHVVALDRSAKAVAMVRAACEAEIRSCRLSVCQSAIEDFTLEPGAPLFDLVFAVRVGALDGRHPRLQEQAHERIARALAPDGRVFIDGGDPLREITAAVRGAVR